MTQLHEGQEVEVLARPSWRKARIVSEAGKYGAPALPGRDKFFYVVELPDGRRAMFDEEHIRERFPLDNFQMRLGSSPIARRT
jgi:hypothetical protein